MLTFSTAAPRIVPGVRAEWVHLHILDESGEHTSHGCERACLHCEQALNRGQKYHGGLVKCRLVPCCLHQA